MRFWGTSIGRFWGFCASAGTGLYLLYLADVAQTLIILVLVVVAVITAVLAVHNLGEAKDRWVTKLSSTAWMGRLVTWGKNSARRRMVTIILVIALGAVVGAITFVVVFVIVRDQIEAQIKTMTLPGGLR